MCFTSFTEFCILSMLPSRCTRCHKTEILYQQSLGSGDSSEVHSLIALPNSLACLDVIALPNSNKSKSFNGRRFHPSAGSVYRFFHPLDVLRSSKSGRSYFISSALSGFASQSIFPGYQYLVSQAYPPTLLAPDFSGSPNLRVLLPASNCTHYLTALHTNSLRLFLCKVLSILA
jgi:hypothetical protein